MHVLLVSKLSGHGGIATYNRVLSRAIVEAGHSASILVGTSDPGGVNQFVQDGVNVYTLPTRQPTGLRRLPLIGRYWRLWEDLRYSRAVARRISHLPPPDVVEFADVEAEAFFYLRRAVRPSVVIRCHTPTFVLRRYHLPHEMPYDTILLSAVERACIRGADALTAPSTDTARLIEVECGLLPETITPIPNPVEAAPFLALDEVRPPSGDITILHVGRLDRVKGVEVLLHAAPLVLKRVPNARFVFVGADRSDGQGSTWRARLESLASEGGFAERVEFLGYLDPHVMLEQYRRADIAVVPSLNYESFSYTCAQAMAAALPVVASRVGGIPETVGEAGLLVEPGNVDALAAALLGLAEDPSRRIALGRASRQRVRDRFAAPHVARQMLAFYSRLIGSGVGR